jgi:uncharacterized protein DUF6916
VLESFTSATFEGRVGERFDLDADDAGVLELVLVECRIWGSDDGGRAPFSLEFLGPVEPVLPQRMYPLSHEQLGAFDLFLVPTGRNEAGTRYEAVFT